LKVEEAVGGAEMREHDERKQEPEGRSLKGLTPKNTPTDSSKAHITV
jgi:hypothetical protein